MRGERERAEALADAETQSDLLTSLRGASSARFGSQFIHPDLPASSFSLAGSGRGVEGFTSGRPNPRLASASNEEYDDAL